MNILESYLLTGEIPPVYNSGAVLGNGGDTRTFQQYDRSNAPAKKQISKAVETVRDPDFTKGAVLGATTDILGMPVDMVSMALAPFGYSQPSQDVVGSSDWLAKNLSSYTASPAETAGRVVGGFLDPATALKVLPMMVGAIKAFHGTPHTFAPEPGLPFGRFKEEAIGTGEGAAAYGHGASYSAEDIGTAGFYKKMLGGTDIKLDGKPYDVWKDNVGSPENKALSWLALDGDAKVTFDKLKAEANDVTQPIHIRESARDAALWLKENKTRYEANPQGHLLELSHEWPDKAREATDPLSKEHLLDWDKPLSEQSDFVKERLAKGIKDLSKQGAGIEGLRAYERSLLSEIKGLENGSKKGYEAYRYITNRNSGDIQNGLWPQDKNPQAASEYLNSLGIPGIKYLDNESRAKYARGITEGLTNNLVMFKPEYTNITARDGITLGSILGN